MPVCETLSIVAGFPGFAYSLDDTCFPDFIFLQCRSTDFAGIDKIYGFVNRWHLWFLLSGMALDVIIHKICKQ